MTDFANAINGGVPSSSVKDSAVHMRTSSDANRDRIVLFTIDDKPYDIPARPRPNIALKYLHKLKETGNGELATAQLLEDMLGVDGYNALMNYDDLTVEEFNQVVEAARDTAMGGMEQATKNS